MLAAGRLVGAVNNHVIVLVARGTRPLARILRLERHAGTLVVEPLEARLHQVVIDVFRDNHGSPNVFATTEQAVGTGLLDGRNIESLYFLAAVVPFVHVGSLELEHRLSGKVADLEPVRIVARKNDRLFGIGSKAQLVHEGGRNGGSRNKKDRGRRHAHSRYTIMNNHIQNIL